MAQVLRVAAAPQVRVSAVAAPATRAALRTDYPRLLSEPQQSPRLAAAASAAALSLAIIAGFGSPAIAKPALLDLPACSNFAPTSSGIAWCELSAGEGEPPAPGDLVVLDYTARAVATGAVYDGSRSFKVTIGDGELIPGWEVGILGDGADLPPVRPGGARTLRIPPALAYGPKGDGCLYGLDSSCRVPPGSDVEVTFRYKGLGY